MSAAEVRADIAAIRSFRQALERYRYEQRQVLDAARREIDLTRASLDRKAQTWRVRLEDRRHELARCQERAAASDGYVDCSSWVIAVEEAEERLANVRSWQARVEDQVGAYEGVAHRFRKAVDDDTRHAMRHLDRVVAALEKVRATRLAGGST